jgi:hypothetical protein
VLDLLTAQYVIDVSVIDRRLKPESVQLVENLLSQIREMRCTEKREIYGVRELVQ